MIDYRPEEGIVYTLRLHNDSQTVIGRIKYALEKATFPFYGCVFRGDPWPQGADAKERYCVEIDRTNWTVRQCYGRHNSAAPDAVRNLAIRVAESLKAKAAEMRKAKKRRAA